MGKLTARLVATLKQEGRYSDGDNLYLNVVGESRTWVFMWKRGGRRREMGLGPTRDVSLAEARDLATVARKQVRDGIDPIEARRKPAGLTFGEVADAYLAAHEGSFKNERHKQQWRKAFKDYCAPIRAIPIADIDTKHVLSVLEPIWLEKPETASRLRGRIEKVLDSARAKGDRTGENPALWRGHLSAVLQKHNSSAKHQPAMPFADLPAFMKRLCERDATSALALQFGILTAARPGETIGARWEEIDMDAAVWMVPAERMKRKILHRVPLSQPALEILAKAHQLGSEPFIFPGQKKGKPFSDAALKMMMKRLGVTNFVPHGFRSSFRDWVGEKTEFPSELAEMALSHAVGNAVERAYRRADGLDKRRRLMNAWASYLLDPVKSVD